MVVKRYAAAALLSISFLVADAQDTVRNRANGPYRFTTVKEVRNTPVKNQNQSSTCWSFSTLSFLESELQRMGKGDYNLSEMFVVRNTYADKAHKYVRMQGKVNYGPGGAFHDVTNCLRKHGLVPEMAYPVLSMDDNKNTADSALPIHHELDEAGKAYLDAVLKMPAGRLSARWPVAYNGILDAYFGAYPNTFSYEGKSYTPQSFAKMLGLNADDYIEISSFTHHPFYSKFVIEVPDNWNADLVYNVKLDEMMLVIDNAIMNGYTVAWGADVSEKGFSNKDAMAIVPMDDKLGKDKIFDGSQKEKVITQELRQQAFDNQSTQDDHGMQIVGIVKDQNGVKYYKVKNSWGSTVNECGGYFYASESYVRYKTTSIMVHKSAVPKEIGKKLDI